MSSKDSVPLDGTKVTFTEWLTLVDEYWAYNGKACDKCDFNDHERGCEFLYNRTVPAGRCPGVDIEQPHG